MAAQSQRRPNLGDKAHVALIHAFGTSSVFRRHVGHDYWTRPDRCDGYGLRLSRSLVGYFRLARTPCRGCLMNLAQQRKLQTKQCAASGCIIDGNGRSVRIGGALNNR